jgi:hypothetical protein
LGKLKLVSYAPQERKLIIVKVGTVSVDKEKIETALKNTYGKLGITYTVAVEEGFATNKEWDTDGVDGLKDTRTGTFNNNFTGEQKKIIEVYRVWAKKENKFDKNAAYLLYTNGASNNTNLLGEMPRDKDGQFGFVFAGSATQEKINKTVAHELGHGVFTLEHAFDAKVGLPNEGDNLMDYSDKGIKLFKYQWDVIAKPGVVWGITEGDDENNMIGGDFSKISKEYKNADGSMTCMTPSNTIITIPSNTSYVYFATADPYYIANTSTRAGENGAIGSLIGFTANKKEYKFVTRGNVGYYAEGDLSKETYYEDTYSAKIKLPHKAVVGMPFYEAGSFGIDILLYKIKEKHIIKDDGDDDKNSIKTFGKNGVSDFFTIVDDEKWVTSTNVINKYSTISNNLFALYDENLKSYKLMNASFRALSPYSKNFLDVNKDLVKSKSPLAAAIISCSYWFSIAEANEGDASCQIDNAFTEIIKYKADIMEMVNDPNRQYVPIKILGHEETQREMSVFFYKYRSVAKQMTLSTTKNLNINSSFATITTASEFKQRINSLQTCELEMLSMENRLRAIEKLEKSNDEEEIIKLITSVKYNAQGAQLISKLFFKQGELFKKLWKRLDFSEYHQFISKVTELVLVNNEEANPSTTFDFGIIRDGDKYHDDIYSTFLPNGEIRIEKVLPNKSAPYYEKFDSLTQMVRIKFPKDYAYAHLKPNQDKDEEAILPAFFISYLINNRDTKEAFSTLRIVGNIIAITAAIPTGGQSITIAAGISAGLAATDLVVMYFEDDLEKTSWGRQFKDIWAVAQIMDAGFAVTNIAYKGAKGIAFKFENFISKLDNISAINKSKIIAAIRKTPILLAEFNMTAASRMFAQKVTAKVEGLLLKNFLKFTNGGELSFANWIDGIIKYEGQTGKLFELGLSSNGGFAKFATAVSDEVVAGEKVIGDINGMRYLDDVTNTVKEGNFSVVYNAATKSFRVVRKIALNHLDDFVHVQKWVESIGDIVLKQNILKRIKNWSDDLLKKLNDVPSRNPKFLAQVEANPSILTHFEEGSKVIANKSGNLKAVELDMYALDKARTTDVVFDGAGNYITNPIKKNLAQLDINAQSGKIRDANGNILTTDNVNGEGLMYVIDDADNIFIGGRNNANLPHPTLIGGKNPNVKCAGMIRFKDGRILEISNNSGHFKPSNTTLQEAKAIFKQKLPDNAFDTKFEVKGF